MKNVLTESEARQMNLNFTGMSDTNKSYISGKIKEQRVLFPNQIFKMVKIPHNPLSRGPNTKPWYRIYTSKPHIELVQEILNRI